MSESGMQRNVRAELVLAALVIGLGVLLLLGVGGSDWVRDMTGSGRDFSPMPWQRAYCCWAYWWPGRRSGNGGPI
jgi:hypothetical protein